MYCTHTCTVHIYVLYTYMYCTHTCTVHTYTCIVHIFVYRMYIFNNDLFLLNQVYKFSTVKPNENVKNNT